MNGPAAGPSRQGTPSVPLEVTGRPFLTQKLAITPGAQKAFLKPDMSQMPVKASALLNQVRAFLPTMAQAQADLEVAMSQDPALKDRLDIENVEGQERVIEMNLGLMPQSDEDETEEVPESKSLSPSIHSSSEWTVDSDPDSAPSPLKSDQDNGFTSDTDSDSTISTSSGSLSSGAGNSAVAASSTTSASSKSHKKSNSKKRPLIQDLGSPGLEPSHNFPSETEENKRARYSMSVQQ